MKRLMVPPAASRLKQNDHFLAGLATHFWTLSSST